MERQTVDRLLLGLLLVVSLGAGVYLWKTFTAPEGVAAADALDLVSDPLQRDLPDSLLARIERGGRLFTLTARARYSVSGYLVSKKAYRLNAVDRFVPWDYAIAWGRVPQMFPHLWFSQSGRFCRYRYRDPSRIDLPHLISHMSNNHLIPANSNLRKALSLGAKGQAVRLEGWLVNLTVTRKGKPESVWTTSLQRDDTGFGACEIIYLTRLRLGDTVYE